MRRKLKKMEENRTYYKGIWEDYVWISLGNARLEGPENAMTLRNQSSIISNKSFSSLVGPVYCSFLVPILPSRIVQSVVQAEDRKMRRILEIRITLIPT
uniref:Uncharacterized protein n=1 Tax=Cucumis sativus TaxID=3659 RepID=A0A0A0L0W3_CUCSA